MSLRIILSVGNLAEMFKVETSYVRMWTRLGLLPTAEDCKPVGYDLRVAEAWVAEGNLEKHRPPEPEKEYKHSKGVYLSKK